jgi:hypothetical protein
MLYTVRLWRFSSVILFLLTISAAVLLHSQAPTLGIRSVDFKNFSYPWEAPNQSPDHLQWMSLGLKNHVQLANGKWEDREEQDLGANGTFTGLTLEGVKYVRLSSQNEEEALVVLRYDTGGTQYHYWVYVFGFSDGAPKLMGFFHAGDRAAHGLSTVIAEKGKLVVDLYDPDKQEGDCCSSGVVRYVFRWRGKGFEAVGHPTKRGAEDSSRRPVTIFGLPIDGK